MNDCNVMITGVGGQGVIVLGKILAYAASLAGYGITGHEQKGEAQRGGMVVSLLRLSSDRQRTCSTRLLSGQLDIMLSMEFLETVRNMYLYKRDTFIFSGNAVEVPAYFRVDRLNKIGMETYADEMKSQLAKMYPNYMLKDYVGRSVVSTGNPMNQNLFMLSDVVKSGALPINQSLVLKSVREIIGLEAVNIILNYG